MRPDIIIIILDGHQYRLEQAGLHGDDPTDPEALVVFRWACSCKRHGQYRHRRGECFRLWTEHVERHGPIEENMA